ncbi:protein of unknown function (plasmid) [Cupriavidus taiwanensis]|uniref:Uncharacterized protein n=1 Tax=Cupriavidus taiwanensis TaxID=164546 RepID=A0A375ECW5_9BURK|nr:protein of unknown function [Cupriavidus taiwanensis]SPD48798.1 protein of unknown function [Cupriavidus taiwanensis]
MMALLNSQHQILDSLGAIGPLTSLSSRPSGKAGSGPRAAARRYKLASCI